VGHALTDDRIDTEYAKAGVGNMHRATSAAIGAGQATVTLGHHRDRVYPLCQAMSMASMIRPDVITIPQMRGDSGCHGLLTYIEMAGAKGNAGIQEFKIFFLEPPDQPHCAVHPSEFVPVNIYCHLAAILQPCGMRVRNATDDQRPQSKTRPDIKLNSIQLGDILPAAVG
jgi:hypothetical protein